MMTINNFKNGLEILVQQIKKDNRLEIVEYKFKEPFSKKTIDEKELEYSVKIDPLIKSFYTYCGGLKFFWKMKNSIGSGISGSYEVEGSINILDIDTLFLGFDGRQWMNELWSINQPEETKKFKKQLKIFDYFGSDNVDAVCFEVRDLHLSPDLWLNNLDFGVFKLNVNFIKYLELLTLTKGLWGWQVFFTDIKWDNQSSASFKRQAEIILETFAMLFPDEPVREQLNTIYRSK
ncbi:MAG: hypothetical protein NVSMB67_30200 [Flavisolibacter sp.]